MSGLARRSTGRVAVLVITLMAAALSLVAVPAPPAAVEQDESCPVEFPTLVPAGSSEGTLYSRALAGLVVCTDPLGTRTRISNRTEAVWLLEEPAEVGFFRVSPSSLNDSFLRLVASPRPAIPSGATIVVPRPPSALAVTVDARLTLAQLAHDELAGGLALDASGGEVLGRFGHLLRSCLDSLLLEMGDPKPLLESGNPAPEIIRAAEQFAATSGMCSDVWRAAGGGSLEEDVAEWRTRSGFAVRTMLAAITYNALTRPPRVVT